MKYQKFIPLTKMEEQSDGTLHVFGLVTEEKPDLDGEVCDYATTQPLYQKRTEERRELTAKIEGMTPSLMAMRAQHDPKQAIGAGRSIVCDDTAKTIKMGFHIVDSEAVKKWKTGIFVGFSQGGEYVSRWDDPVYKGCTRYTADPMEVSSVDSPCLPSALAESMKGRTVTLTKSAGTSEEVPLVILPVHEAQLERHERVLKGILEMLKVSEGEKASAIISLETVVKEAPDELAAAGKGEKGMKLTDLDSLKKAAKTIHDHLEGLKEKHAAMGEHMDKCFKSMGEKHAAVGEHIEKCMKSAKDAMEGDEPEKVATVDVAKVEDPRIAAMQKSIDDLSELVKKLPAPGTIAHTGVGDGLAKVSEFQSLLTN